MERTNQFRLLCPEHVSFALLHTYYYICTGICGKCVKTCVRRAHILTKNKVMNTDTSYTYLARTAEHMVLLTFLFFLFPYVRI